MDTNFKENWNKQPNQTWAPALTLVIDDSKICGGSAGLHTVNSLASVSLCEPSYLPSGLSSFLCTFVNSFSLATSRWQLFNFCMGRGRCLNINSPDLEEMMDRKTEAKFK